MGYLAAILRRLAQALEAPAPRSIEQQRADLLLHATQAGVLDWDAATRRYAYSARFAEMLGHPAGTDTSRWPPLFEFIHAEDRERIRASFLAQLRDTSVKDGVRVWPDSPDFRLRKADGSYLWIHASALSLAGADGRTLRQVCTFIDISERKRQEEALLRSEARYDAAMASIDQGVYDWNILAGTIHYSDSVYRALGMPRSMKTPQDWVARVHPEDLPRYNAALAAHFKGATKRFECDYRYRGPDGGWRWARQRGLATRDAQGRAVRMVGATGDITELVAMEERIRQQEALTRAIVARAPNAIFAKDRQGRFTLVNRGWSEMSGVPEDEAIGRSVHDLYPAAAAARFAEEDERLMAQGADAPPIEALHTGPRPGQYRIVRKAVLAKDGAVTGLVCSSTDISELKRMEFELRDQMDLTRMLIEENPSAMYLKDTEGRYVTVNDAWLKMVGLTREEAIGRNVLELFPEEESERYHAEDMRLLGQRGTGVSEVESLRTGPDGQPQWVIIRKAVLRRADGTVIGLIGANTDITRRKRAEAELANQFKFVNDLVDSVPASIAMRDTEGKFLMVNRVWEQWFGAKREDVVGRGVFERAGVQRGERLLALDRAVLERGPGAMVHEDDFEYRGRRYTQTRSVMADAEGKVLGVLIASIDTTERHAMEQAMERQRDRMQLLLRASKAGFLDWDAVSDTRTYSERFKEMLGYAPDADTAAWPSLFDLVHPDDREATRASFREMLRHGATAGERVHGPLECRLRKADGSYIWVRGEGLAQVGPDGRVRRFLASYTDITHLRELNRVLEESVRLREEVDRISRHDLKTPISSIVGIPRLLRDSGRIAPEDGELLAMVEQAGYRLLGMINLSLDMFRMEQGTYPFSPGAVDLLEVLGNVVRDLRPQADSLRVALVLEGPRVHARGETLLCYSLLANLVKNALEASPAGGSVKISLAAEQDMALVRVHNAGVVPEAVRARFFDKYSSAGKKSGTGLGTYSALLMARTQRGNIEMQTSEAGGTTLTVRLHAAPAPAAQDAAEAVRAAPAAAEPPRSLAVLVVDDDEYTRVVVQRFLPSGTRSRTASNGREALDTVTADPPDAVVMDLDMPVLGGLDAAARIREWERETGRPRGALIAMSSHDDAATRKRCLEAGFDTYLEKPVSPEALRRALAEFARAPLAGDPVRVDRDLEGALPGFLDSRRALAGELAAALAAGDAEKARAIAHKLAGSLALYGFRWAAGQGKLIERRARARALEGLAEEAAALRRHLDEVKVEIRT